MFDLYGVVCAALFGIALYFVVTKLINWLTHYLRKRKKIRVDRGEHNTRSATVQDASSQGTTPPKRLVSAHAKQPKNIKVGIGSVDQVFPGTKGRKR